MAYAKKASKNEAYQKLKTDLKEGNPVTRRTRIIDKSDCKSPSQAASMPSSLSSAKARQPVAFNFSIILKHLTVAQVQLFS